MNAHWVWRLVVLLLLANGNAVFAQPDLEHKELIGKTYRLKMKAENPRFAIEYRGTIIGMDEGTVSLQDVTQFGEGDRGIPFFSSPQADRLFKNVGQVEKELPYGIILKREQVQTWRAVEVVPDDGSQKANEPVKLSLDPVIARLADGAANRYCKLGVSVWVSVEDRERVKGKLHRNDDQFQEQIRDVLSRNCVTELQDHRGRSSLLDQVRSILKDEIDADMIVQLGDLSIQ